jgi:pimeloyl-ACP methyl ester carboxylesterase
MIARKRRARDPAKAPPAWQPTTQQQRRSGQEERFGGPRDSSPRRLWPARGGPVRWCWLGAALAASLAWAAPAQSDRPERRQTAPRAVAPAAAGGDFARRVQIRGGRRLYLECRGTGRPTVILVSGYGNGGDVWSMLDPGVRRPPVLAGMARYGRVCAYDRPNTILQPDRPGRSDPVPQPRTAADAVADLHALLRAARLRGPYVLVGHSLGGLFVRLYASTYPRQVAGLVLVDATYELLRKLFSPEQWTALARSTLEPVPGLDPPLELFDQDASFDQMLRAKGARPLRPTLPLVVLSHGLPPTLPPDLVLPPGYPDAATLERASRAAQNELGGLLPYARHVIARRSGHYIQNAQPELVIDAVRRVLGMVRPAAVRCRGDADSCSARVSLTGGASNKKVVIDLTDIDLRLVSVRPNRRSLRGAYGLFGQRLRRGGSQYVVRLNAVQSIPRGSDLIFTFRASGGP